MPGYVARRMAVPPGDQRRPKLRRLAACVGNSSPFSDHRTLQPARELAHTTAAIQGSANSTPRARPMRSAGTRHEVCVAAVADASL
jgi:hypothetical protein